ncbi:ketopantoate reductase family protein [Paenibacillus sp. NEAU-GSW1]|uniref:ketopantoate reductase family protein n=1 Tax=Paenibacillus sp. NEAU-GSW1 TaxID=2682486 RepID=UPI0012E1129E|nr:2-dehydropantoate 2-reductase N-terminal domain-containing protein [Paenibacillus sp. NEAU-GSW1]MUT64834.1 ketopantoate reductase family protein [Paenibacillus sp. NEAU-GSW1]
MRILIYGAGILGSFMAHSLIRGGHEVTVLARGQRAEELKRNGIVIRHVFQLKTTKDCVRVIETLMPQDKYDFIFTVMKYNDMPAILPFLAKNESHRIVLIGNNVDAERMEQEILTQSSVPKEVAFGFQLSGGRREKHRMLSIRGQAQMVYGSLSGELGFKPFLEQAFSATGFRLTDMGEDIDAWLKSHIIPIIAMNAASRVHGGKANAVAKDRELLRRMIDAMDEGFRVLEAAGYPAIPENQTKLARERKRLAYTLFKMYYTLPIHKLMTGDQTEIDALQERFDHWRAASNIPTPGWDYLSVSRDITKTPCP